MLKSWKTTSAGVLTIAGALVHFAFACANHTLNETIIVETMTALVAGWGLIQAQDAKPG